MKPWTKLQYELLEDQRIKKLIKELAMKGLGTYVILLLLLDCEGTYSKDVLATRAMMYTGKRLALKVIEGYGLFEEDDDGFLRVSGHACVRVSGHASGHASVRVSGHASGRVSGHANVPSSEKEIEENKKKNIIFKNKKAFQKPSILEIEEYILENYFNVDASMFYNYYESRGWIFGNAPMTDWHAAIKSWQNNPKFQKVNSNYDETTYINDMY